MRSQYSVEEPLKKSVKVNFTEEQKQKSASFWKGAILHHIMLNSTLTQGKERDVMHRSWKKPRAQTPNCCYEWAKWRWLPLQALSCPKAREGRQGVEVGLQGESAPGSFTERSVGNGTGTSWHYSTALWVNISHTLAFFLQFQYILPLSIFYSENLDCFLGKCIHSSY